MLQPLKLGTLATPRRSGAKMENLRNFFLFAAFRFAVRIAAPFVLAQHKGHERRGETRKEIRSTVPIVPEIAF